MSARNVAAAVVAFVVMTEGVALAQEPMAPDTTAPAAPAAPAQGSPPSTGTSTQTTQAGTSTGTMETTTKGGVGTASVAASGSGPIAEEIAPKPKTDFRSPQNFALEFRFGPYRPNIDDEAGLTKDASGRGPYERAFGHMPRLLAALEFDWQLLRIPHVGSLGPGAGIGYTSMGTTVTTLSGRPSGDETSLEIYPFWGVGVLRVDVLWRDAHIPLVPYAKLGIAGALWRATNSGGTAQADNVSGKGTTWGTQAALGIMFALDALDPGAQRNMDNMLGINGTYLFAEYYRLGLTGIGQSKPLLVGASTWTAGFAFEM